MSEPQPASKDPKVIKRYTNRKLYDTVESRYVTLDEIAEMVKQGVEVKIIDNRSKEDLTSVTLAQIVFEEEKKKSQMPLDVLREIIRHPGESLTDFYKAEVGPRIDRLLRRDDEKKDEKKEEKKDEQKTEPVPTGDGATGTTGIFAAPQRVIEDWQKRIDERVKLVVDNVVGNLPAMGRDLSALVQRIDELEKKLQELEASKKK
jgi:polyhydroxyalkanoate synthesis repressor PhaR